MTSGPFFDTNIVIDWLNQRPQAAAEMALYGHHRISRIVWFGVLAGEVPADRDRIERVLGRFDVVELDVAVARTAADIRHRSRTKLIDALVLATARVHGTMLITRNTQEFPATMLGIRVPYIL